MSRPEEISIKDVATKQVFHQQQFPGWLIIVTIR